MRTKVAPVIGQASAPDSLVRTTAKPGVPSQLALRAAADRLAVLVHQFGSSELTLLGIGVLDIADRALGAGDGGGDAFVAAGADANGPIDRGDRSDSGLPDRAHFGEVVGEGEGRAGTIGAMHHDNRLRRQL